MELKRIFHFPKWTTQYESSWLKHDLSAGLTVGVLLIPQAMAYAMLAGLPPIYGLYASTIPPMVYALFGTCRQLSIGPAAMVSLLTASGIGLLADSGSTNYLALVVMLTLTVGLIQFVLGIARLGFLVNFLSHPVILGFTSAAAVIIALSQLKYFLGIPSGRSQYLHELIPGLVREIPHTHWLTLLVSVISLVALLFAKKYFPKFPASLVIVAIAILSTWMLQLDQHGLAVIGNITSGFPSPAFPPLNEFSILTVLSTATAIAIISFMESSAIARTLQARHKDYKIDPNKELMSLGLSNITSALFRAMPVTGGLSRSVVNEQAGARSGLASILSSVVIILTLLFFTRFFYYLPTAILAVIIMVAVSSFIRVEEIKTLWHLDRKDFWMMLITFLCTLFLGITFGIGVGIILSLAWIIFESSYPHHAELGRVPGTTIFRNTRRFADLVREDGILIFRFDAPLFFANVSRFRELLEQYVRQRAEVIRHIIVDMESNHSIDSSAMVMLMDVFREMQPNGYQFYLVEVKGPVRDKLYKAGITSIIGEQNIFVTIQEALAHIAGTASTYSPSVAFQTNVARERM